MYVMVDAAEFHRHISVLFIHFIHCNQWHVLGISTSKNALTEGILHLDYHLYISVWREGGCYRTFFQKSSYFPNAMFCVVNHKTQQQLSSWSTFVGDREG